MVDITLLNEEQVLGKNRSKIFKYSAKSSISDFAILLGGQVSDTEYLISNYLKVASDRSAPWALKDNFFQYGKQICDSGECDKLFINARDIGIRPCTTYSSIKPFCQKSYKLNDTHLVEYGYYPQTVVRDESIVSQLEEAYSELIFATNNSYTTDSVCITNRSELFTSRTFDEFEHPYGSGKRYIRFVGDDNCKGKMLSDKTIVEKGKPYWIKVEPIIWHVDEDNDLAVASKILFAGVHMNYKETYDGNFNNTHMKKFLDIYFSKEIAAIAKIKGFNNKNEEEIRENRKISTRKENPYDFETEKVSEEDIIRGAIESNVAVFLHGKSSDGKSSRVKQIDPDCEIVYLRNATPDSLNGKSIYNEEKGEMIDVPPSWYRKIKEKCEKDPSKLHIVFFDELTNAMPSIQGMAFNIILDKEVNGVWKLPNNCRIVAAGNDMDDSLSANEMAEPLFNRFAHVYIETTVASWLTWAAKKENNIHPAIYAYISYKSSAGIEVLRTSYDGKQPNADPRKWEMSSKILHTTRKPKMLEGLIGTNLTNDFCDFCSQKVVTIDMVKNDKDIHEIAKSMKNSQKYATALNLSKCEEKDLKIVREFISELGEGPLSMFDILWSKGEEKRLEKIAKLRLESTARR